MNQDLQINNIVIIDNINGLYHSMEDYLHKLGKIIEIDPYLTPTLKVQFSNGSIFPFHVHNVKIASPQQAQLYYTHIIKDPWRTA